MTFAPVHEVEYGARFGREGHTITGHLRVLTNVWSPQLHNHRDVLIWLPESYVSTDRRYAVIYMHDGQNLFDRATAYGGTEWQVDESMQTLSPEGLEAIIVGVNHMGDQRIAEYNPFPGRWPGLGEQYMDFLGGTLKPMIDGQFRTRPDRAHTGLLGSSMGGLISLYGFFRRPDLFSLCGAMSPSLWMSQGAIYDYVRHSPFVSGKIYLDNGTREMNARHMRDVLLEKGYRPRRNLRYVVEKGAHHTESAWARRFPEAIRFLLKKPASGRLARAATA